MSYEDSASFPADHEGRYYADLKVSGPGGSNLIPVRALSDTGADFVMLTLDTARKLGYDLNMIRDNMGIEGISKTGGPGGFKVTDAFCQIGNMKPIQIPIAMAITAEALQENLLGDKGILSSGLIESHYDDKGVTYKTKIANASLAGHI